MAHTTPTDEAQFTAKTLTEAVARYDYTGTSKQDHHMMVPLPRIFNMLGDAMVGNAKRISKMDTAKAPEEHIEALRAEAVKIGRIGKQLQQITSALAKISTGAMPDAGELRALKGDSKLKLLSADEALIEALAWFKVATREDHDQDRPPLNDQRILERQLYELFDHYVPVNDGASIPNLLLNSSSLLSRVAAGLPPPPSLTL